MSLSEAFTGSGSLPQHALGTSVQVENQLWMVGSRQAAPRIRGRETFMSPLHTEEVQKHNFSQKCNCCSGSPGMAHLPTVSSQGCIPKKKDGLLYPAIPPPFCPLCCTRNCYIKQKGCAEGGGVCEGLQREILRIADERCLSTFKSQQKWSDTEAWASLCWSQQNCTFA